MSRLTTTIIFLILLIAAPSFAATTLYIAPDGDDKNPGTLEAPLASIDGARNALRKLRADDELTSPICVKIAAGEYVLQKPIRFMPEDSGTRIAPIVYQGAGPGKTILSGGRRITGWRKGEGPLWQTKIEDVAAGKIYFHQLFVNSKRAQRARTPNESKLNFDGPIKPIDRKGDHTTHSPESKQAFRFKEGDFQKWKNLDDVMVTVYHSWTASLHWIKELDLENRTIRFHQYSVWPIGFFKNLGRYRVENYFEALDSPGEWYLDRKTGVLSYWPLPGEDMTRAETIAPILTDLVRFVGDPEADRPVEYLTLCDLSLQHADWRFRQAKKVDGQAHCAPKSSVIKAIGLRYSAIENCEIAHAGSHAICLEKGCQDNRIAHCHLHDLGGGGIYVGQAGGVYTPGRESFKVQRNHIDNNFIHDITHLLHGAVGIWVGSSSFNTISHNEISDFDYTGISVGWCWDRNREIFQQGNLIEYNHVHHTNAEVLSDNGGIYTLGWSPGSVIRNNLVHDIGSFHTICNARGLYLDGNTSCYLVENNICYNIEGYGITAKGEYNIIRNNIFAFCDDAGLHRYFKWRTKTYDYDLNHVYHNIILQRDRNMTCGYYLKRWTEIDHNLYWSTKHGADIVFNDWSTRVVKDAPKGKDLSFATWQKLERDQNSLIVDPGFVDPEKGNFQFKPNSPATRIGYKPTDTLQKAGLYGDETWINLPSAYSCKP